MNNFECTVTIADIYGEEWWERNREELDRGWEWGFGVAKGGEHARSITPIFSNGPYIILQRHKPKPPTLREVYGTDEVTIPQGWEWAGEFAPPMGYTHLDRSGGVAVNRGMPEPRLILHERPKKVWFKAEAVARKPRFGEWIFVVGTWVTADIWQLDNKYLCATRHEEIGDTVQVVTQADVDKVVGR